MNFCYSLNSSHPQALVQLAWHISQLARVPVKQTLFVTSKVVIAIGQAHPLTQHSLGNWPRPMETHGVVSVAANTITQLKVNMAISWKLRVVSNWLSSWNHLVQYIWFKFELGSTGNTADLTSPEHLGLITTYCMRFWYWRHISQVNKIEVLTLSSPVGRAQVQWTSNFTFPQKMWHRGQASIYLSRYMKIIIRATHLGNIIQIIICQLFV